MNLINHEELKKQLASGEITSLDDITVDDLNGLNEAIKAVYPKAEIQRCKVHQIRSSF